ncbi:MAG: phosphomannomutase, partial [Candidatus Thermofonsia Clade 1 bacterium]
DLGIGFDGDADRCGIIDENGHHIAADRLLALLARDLLSRHKGAKIVFDVKASQALEDEIRAHGGIPIMWKTGHSLMKAKMAEEGAPLGGEVSGHLFIGEDYYGFDDAPLVSLKVLEIFSKETRTVSQVFDTIPKLVATPEVIVSAPDDRKFQIIEALQREFAAEHQVITLDGARVTFEHGWGLVRASNTQPAITMRFEARTKADLVAIMQDFDRRLARYPEVSRDKLQEQIAAFSA